MTDTMLIKVAAPVIGILLSGNIWFVNRLVMEIDNTKSIVYQMRQDFAVMQAIGQTNQNKCKKGANHDRD